eukprot:CAMPEP_0182424494 /NCGR_PEP_ID=MMETSP1167-20130531/10704_1 /TAXON_ID=2988 /ORGANISM="Mallomonas Sp, Strain CCMP3275" /LENGTH=286 /DNA_ID=CAMNT_0024604351 /DNA_START=23 /DNA_END=880 /DNA_ORIENTATION=+
MNDSEVIESEEKKSSNRQKLLDAQQMSERFQNEIDNVDDDDDNNTTTSQSSQRQKILRAQIMDEKVNEENDEVEPILNEFGSGIDQLPESNQEALSEMDDTLSKLKQWQSQREEALKKQYEEREREIEQENEKEIEGEGREEEKYITPRVADEKAINSLQAILSQPMSKAAQLADLSCLDEQLDRAASGFPSPEKLRRELRELTFSRSSRELLRSECEVDLAAYRREDEVMEESAILEEECGQLESRLRDFGGELDLLLYGVGGLTMSEIKGEREREREREDEDEK